MPDNKPLHIIHTSRTPEEMISANNKLLEQIKLDVINLGHRLIARESELKSAEALIKHQGQSILIRQEKYNKLKEAFEELLEKTADSAFENSDNEDMKSVFIADWNRAAGLKNNK